MVRTYVRKTVPYDKEAMKSAVEAVASGDMGYKKAAGIFNVKRETLRDHVRKRMGRPDKDFSERLISEVRKRPSLYDTTHPAYKDRYRLDAEWNAVAQAMKLETSLVKKKWQNLRGSYSKSLALESAGGSERVTRFYLHDQLYFLRGHMLNGPAVGNFSVVDEPAEEVEVELEDQKPEITISEMDNPLPSTPPSTTPSSPTTLFTTTNKRKLDAASISSSSVDNSSISYIQVNRDTEKDPALEYFKGLLPQVNELTRKRKRDFFQGVSALLFQHLNEQEDEAEGTT